jgi:DNA-binding transcriptional LysR family regulator
MNLKQIKYFCEVVEEGSAKQAAEKLHIAPTAISMQISDLEMHLGGLLFNRKSRPMQLTSLGKFFYPKAKEILANSVKLVDEAKGIASGEKGWLSIGFTRSTIYSVLPRAIQKFREKYPDIQLDLIEILSEHQVEYLNKGLIHIGISRFIGDYSKEIDLSYTHLFDDPLIAALPKNFLQNKKLKNTAAIFDQLPFISYPKDPNSSFSIQCIEILKLNGAHPTILHEAKEIHTALGLVAAGLGGTLVGQSVAENNRTDLEFIKLSDIAMNAAVFAITTKEMTKTADAFLKDLIKESQSRD